MRTRRLRCVSATEMQFVGQPSKTALLYLRDGLRSLISATCVQVRWEDQQQICEFGRINARRHELEDEISDLEKKEQDISDAEEGVMLVDESQEGATKLLIGETFVDVDSSKALEFIQQAQADDKAALERARAELKACLDRMAGLKKSLYARFGRNINLEE